jgi:hypothetical protein
MKNRPPDSQGRAAIFYPITRFDRFVPGLTATAAASCGGLGIAGCAE